MLNINELKKYLENVAYNITSYDNYIIYYDSQNDKILKNDDVDKIKTMYTNIFNKSLVPLLTNIDYLKIKLSVHQIIYRFKENYLQSKNWMSLVSHQTVNLLLFLQNVNTIATQYESSFMKHVILFNI